MEYTLSLYIKKRLAGKIILLSFIIFTVISTVSCTSARVKQKPDNENNWELCRFCHGTGYLKISSSKNSADDVTNNPNNRYACCLIPFGIIGALADDEYPSKQNHDPVKPEYDLLNMEQNQKISEGRVPERSTVTKKIKCPHCEGRGWIKSGTEKNRPKILNNDVEIIERNGQIEFMNKN